jgi:hypothetical protein
VVPRVPHFLGDPVVNHALQDLANAMTVVCWPLMLWLLTRQDDQ